MTTGLPEGTKKLPTRNNDTTYAWLVRCEHCHTVLAVLPGERLPRSHCEGRGIVRLFATVQMEMER